MRCHIYSAFATLKIGLDLLQNEGIVIENLLAHGGLFKTPEVAQRILAAATATPVTVSKTAGEGGPFGMAVLAAYTLDNNGYSLPQFHDNCIFSNVEYTTITANKNEIEGFNRFLNDYKKSFAVESAAAEVL